MKYALLPMLLIIMFACLGAIACSAQDVGSLEKEEATGYKECFIPGEDSLSIVVPKDLGSGASLTAVCYSNGFRSEMHSELCDPAYDEVGVYNCYVMESCQFSRELKVRLESKALGQVKVGIVLEDNTVCYLECFTMN